MNRIGLAAVVALCAGCVDAAYAEDTELNDVRPWPYKAGDEVACKLRVYGTPSNRFVDLDTPRTVNWNRIVIDSGSVFISVSEGGIVGTDEQSAWFHVKESYFGGEVTVALNGQDPATIKLPLAFAPLPGCENCLDVTDTKLGDMVLSATDNTTLKLRGPALYTYLSGRVRRYREGKETWTFEFKDFAKSKRFCERANDI